MKKLSTNELMEILDCKIALLQVGDTVRSMEYKSYHSRRITEYHKVYEITKDSIIFITLDIYLKIIRSIKKLYILSDDEGLWFHLEDSEVIDIIADCLPNHEHILI